MWTKMELSLYTNGVLRNSPHNGPCMNQTSLQPNTYLGQRGMTTSDHQQTHVLTPPSPMDPQAVLQHGQWPFPVPQNHGQATNSLPWQQPPNNQPGVHPGAENPQAAALMRFLQTIVPPPQLTTMRTPMASTQTNSGNGPQMKPSNTQQCNQSRNMQGRSTTHQRGRAKQRQGPNNRIPAQQTTMNAMPNQRQDTEYLQLSTPQVPGEHIVGPSKKAQNYYQK